MDQAVITAVPAVPALRDQVSLGVIMAAVPRDVVDDAVTACGAQHRRSDGKLPPHVTAYATLALCLFGEDDYSEVLTKVTGSLTAFGCWDASWTPPTPSALTQARKRLGPDVARTIFETVAGPAATPTTPGAWLGDPHHAGLRPQRRLVAIDGFDVDVPDTEANAAEFGYAASTSPAAGGRSAYPKARVVVLTECATHALLAADVAPYGVGEKTLPTRLYPRISAGEVLLADRGFYSYPAWTAAQSGGGDVIWRAPTQLRLDIVEALDDGSYLSVLIDPDLRAGARTRVLTAARESRTEATGFHHERGHLVRVVDYDVPDRVGAGDAELITLITTILDPDDVSAEELAAAYHQRWEEESTFDELKTHLRGPGRVLRSRLPDLVHQEIWAYLTLHHALAVLRARAAEAAAIDPDRISYTRLLRIIRRTATGTADFPPSAVDDPGPAGSPG